MRTKIRAQRPSSETKPNKKVEPDTDTDSEDSIDLDRDGVISAQESRATTATSKTAGAAEPRTSPSWKQLVLLALCVHPLRPLWPRVRLPHIPCLWV